MKTLCRPRPTKDPETTTEHHRHGERGLITFDAGAAAEEGKEECISGCGRDTCGDEDTGGMRVCSACHGAPTQTTAGPRWNHFQSDEQVVEFATLWDEMQRTTSLTTVEREAFRPTRRDWFCDRGQCFFRQAAK